MFTGHLEPIAFGKSYKNILILTYNVGAEGLNLQFANNNDKFINDVKNLVILCEINKPLEQK